MIDKLVWFTIVAATAFFLNGCAVFEKPPLWNIGISAKYGNCAYHVKYDWGFIYMFSPRAEIPKLCGGHSVTTSGKMPTEDMHMSFKDEGGVTHNLTIPLPALLKGREVERFGNIDIVFDKDSVSILFEENKKAFDSVTHKHRGLPYELIYNSKKQ